MAVEDLPGLCRGFIAGALPVAAAATVGFGRMDIAARPGSRPGGDRRNPWLLTPNPRSAKILRQNPSNLHLTGTAQGPIDKGYANQ